ncbi:MAG: LytR/AlgR family response regulator transcription factor [Chitinophagaceae bacterium]
MTTYDVCIVEDELPAALALEQDIRSYCPQVGKIWTHTSLEDSVRCIEKNSPDIVFLDIQLGKRNGFELFNYFPVPSFQTIMVTAYDSFAIQALRVQVADYLLKPVGGSQIQQAFRIAISRIKTSQQEIQQAVGRKNIIAASAKPDQELRAYYADKIAVPAQDRITLIQTDHILYCSAQSNYCWIFLRNGDKLCASVTLGTMIQKLDPGLFIRLHQSYFVAKKSIYRFFYAEGGKVELENGTMIPVSRSFKPALLTYLKSFTDR